MVDQFVRVDPTGAMGKGTGIERRVYEALHEKMLAVRDEVAVTDMELLRSGDVPPEKQPLDAAFLDMPERLLAEYQQRREQSELGRVLKIARRLQETVDRVVLLGIGGSYMGARALMEACCQPYFNELSRGQRGGKPRLYFEGNNVDNDAMRGLLELLGAGRPARSLDDRWAIIVVSKSGTTLETAVAFRIFLQALETSVGSERLADLVVPITGPGSKLAQMCQALGCQDILPVPEGVGGRFSVLSAVGLLPAAVLGINVVALLEGAAAMTEHFRTAPPGANAVLDYVNICHCAEEQGRTIRVLCVWSKALEAVGLWYDQLLSESLGKQEKGATPITAVNTRDLHSRAQQHQEGRRDKLFTNLIVHEWRTDPLLVGRRPADEDGLNDLAERSLPQIMEAAVWGTNEALQQAGRPTVDIHLPAINEFYLGQLLQMLMLATVVEGRLIGVNPYGQPGVEAYKKAMYRRLGR
ncbi:MAG: glucose-6-phosphate isomerase [Pirellulaceae bacterium]|nr:MAG: glucose-6-phosphate isomerase [Pirellulaceae bacterium]